MLGIYCKKKGAIYQSGNGFRKECSGYMDKFRIINKNAVREIFVDETLIQIDGQNYWL
jgi:hypothetical protein